MKTQLFKRRVLNGNRSDNFMFTAPEGTEEIIENDFFKQEISTDWAVHYAQQTNPVRVAATMRECLEAFPVERINSKYFIGDNTTNDLYYDELSKPSHLSNCVESSEEESFGTVYFVEVVDATLPAYFYMEKQQKAVTYVPFMGWFTAFGRNRSRCTVSAEEIQEMEAPTTKKATVDYRQLRQIYDAFGSVFFGYVRAMNIAHQGWMYIQAQELAQTLDVDNECGVVYPDVLNVQENYIDVQYTSRSGNKYRFTHSGRQDGNLYYEIDVEYPSNSQLAETIKAIIQDAV